ncbi:MAG: amino acid--tRNA ligase-related protein [Candidatus Paceibacterota bacterium]|jgi:aspartyl/asparaginyl-tRNA synthetase
MSNGTLVDPVSPEEYHRARQKLQEFFTKKGLTWAVAQQRLSILSACENHLSIALHAFAGQTWPLHQTNQMELEKMLLENQGSTGYFCDTTSYREEPTPKKGRHNLIFPMVEFELPGNFEVLLAFLQDLVQHLGFVKAPAPVVDYRDYAKKCGVEELGDEHETQLFRELGPVVMLVDFPMSTSPFWNMRLDGGPGEKIARKCDVIVCGQETIGSAERSCDPEQMRKSFRAVSGGDYARTLFARFCSGRVLEELEDFLSLPFFPRCGGGIGMTRLIRATRMVGLIDK